MLSATWGAGKVSETVTDADIRVVVAAIEARKRSDARPFGMDGSSSSRCVMSSEGGDQVMLATPPGPSATTTTRVLPASGGDGGEPRWTSRLRGLLERVGQRDELRLTVGRAHERDADRETEREPRGHADERVAGERRGLRARAQEGIAVHLVDLPG